MPQGSGPSPGVIPRSQDVVHQLNLTSFVRALQHQPHLLFRQVSQALARVTSNSGPGGGVTGSSSGVTTTTATTTTLASTNLANDTTFGRAAHTLTRGTSSLPRVGVTEIRERNSIRRGDRKYIHSKPEQRAGGGQDDTAKSHGVPDSRSYTTTSLRETPKITYAKSFINPMGNKIRKPYLTRGAHDLFDIGYDNYKLEGHKISEGRQKETRSDLDTKVTADKRMWVTGAPDTHGSEIITGQRLPHHRTMGRGQPQSTIGVTEYTPPSGDLGRRLGNAAAGEGRSSSRASWSDRGNSELPRLTLPPSLPSLGRDIFGPRIPALSTKRPGSTSVSTVSTIKVKTGLDKRNDIHFSARGFTEQYLTTDMGTEYIQQTNSGTTLHNTNDTSLSQIKANSTIPKDNVTDVAVDGVVGNDDIQNMTLIYTSNVTKNEDVLRDDNDAYYNTSHSFIDIIETRFNRPHTVHFEMAFLMSIFHAIYMFLMQIVTCTFGPSGKCASYTSSEPSE